MTEPGEYAYRIVRPLTWRTDETGAVHLDNLHGGATVKLAAPTAPLLEAIAREAPRDELAIHLPEARLRQFLLNLMRMGYVDIPLDRPDVFAGRYQVVKELGRGGVGVAYLCDDLDTAERVVVKRAWDYYLPEAAAEEAVRRESHVLARLAHDGIVARRDAFDLGGRLHIVRAFVDGDELARHHRRPLKDAAAVRATLCEVADVVAHVHARGYALLDLRPSNFMRRRTDEQLMLMDVGHCRAPATDGHVRLASPVGAPGFMPPEMRRDALGSVRGDVWALGALGLFLATGLAPARTGHVAPLLARIDPDLRERLAPLLEEKVEARPADMAAAARLVHRD